MIVSVIIILIIVLYVCCDVNYLIRTYLTIWAGRLFQRKYSLDETTSIYGLGTSQDVDTTFRHIRLSRLIRELDFARFHFWDRTGIYQRSVKLGFGALQAATTAVIVTPAPIFIPFRIDTRILYWDDKSFFMNHQVVTLHDGRVRAIFISRQHVIGANVKAVLQDLPVLKPLECPEEVKQWIKCMQISSIKLRNK